MDPQHIGRVDSQHVLRVDERERGRQRLRRLTGWTVAGALTAATVFGVAFAHRDAAAANPSTGDGTQVGTGTEGTDDGGGLQPPAQAPGNAGTGGSRVHSGGS